MADAVSLLRRLKAEKSRSSASTPATAPREPDRPDAPTSSEIAAVKFQFSAIDDHRLGLPRVCYVNSALASVDCSVLLASVDSASPESWVTLRHRRLQNWGGTVTPHGLESILPLPPWLMRAADLLVETGVFPRESGLLLLLVRRSALPPAASPPPASVQPTSDPTTPS